MKKALQISVLTILLAVVMIFGFGESDNMIYFILSKVVAIFAGYIIYILTKKWADDFGINLHDKEA